MERLQTFISSPSRNHLVLANDCLNGLEYLDVGKEMCAFIEDFIGDRRLSMRAQDKLSALFREHVKRSEQIGQYLALTNLGILYEPILKIDVESVLMNWSQNITLVIHMGKGFVSNQRFYLIKDCSAEYSTSLQGINYIVLS